MKSINVETIFSNFNKFISIILIGGIIFLIGRLAYVVNNRHDEDLDRKKDTICPALLSISRSSRDTLIVMRAENLCNEYVLDSLK